MSPSDPRRFCPGNLGLLGLPLGLTLDRIVVTPGLLGGGEQLAAGTVNVFQKLFFRRLSLENAGAGTVLFTETTPPPAFFALVPDLAAETDELPPFAAVTKNSPLLALARFFSPPLIASGESCKIDKLISQGADLFFNETFKGNGRTCGTCHPSDNNFTIDPAFIATRPANDPLFVAEFNPTLAQLERPALMRSHGLILENVDGLENPTVKFVMRGVPHTLGMQVSLTQDTTQVPTPFEMTGWSGDGAPGTGSLREFAIGAVTQHFTKRLNRVAGTDFKLPKEHELDAMEAFQLSLGREKDFDLTKITFKRTIIDLNAGEDRFVLGDTDPDPAYHRHVQFLPQQRRRQRLDPSGCEPQLQHQRRRPAASRAHPAQHLPERRRLWKNSRRPQRPIRQRDVQHGIGGGGGRHRALLP